MGCGASAQVGVDDGSAPADGDGSNVGGLDGEAAEANGIEHDLEVADLDRSNSQFLSGESEI